MNYENLKLDKKKKLDLLHFKERLGETLILVRSTIAKKRRRPSNSLSSSLSPLNSKKTN